MGAVPPYPRGIRVAVTAESNVEFSGGTPAFLPEALQFVAIVLGYVHDPAVGPNIARGAGNVVERKPRVPAPVGHVIGHHPLIGLVQHHIFSPLDQRARAVLEVSSRVSSSSRILKWHLNCWRVQPDE